MVAVVSKYWSIEKVLILKSILGVWGLDYRYQKSFSLPEAQIVGEHIQTSRSTQRKTDQSRRSLFFGALCWHMSLRWSHGYRWTSTAWNLKCRHGIQAGRYCTETSNSYCIDVTKLTTLSLLARTSGILENHGTMQRNTPYPGFACLWNTWKLFHQDGIWSEGPYDVELWPSFKVFRKGRHVRLLGTPGHFATIDVCSYVHDCSCVMWAVRLIFLSWIDSCIMCL